MGKAHGVRVGVGNPVSANQKSSVSFINVAYFQTKNEYRTEQDKYREIDKKDARMSSRSSQYQVFDKNMRNTKTMAWSMFGQITIQSPSLTISEVTSSPSIQEPTTISEATLPTSMSASVCRENKQAHDDLSDLGQHNIKLDDLRDDRCSSAERVQISAPSIPHRATFLRQHKDTLINGIAIIIMYNFYIIPVTYKLLSLRDVILSLENASIVCYILHVTITLVLPIWYFLEDKRIRKINKLIKKCTCTRCDNSLSLCRNKFVYVAFTHIFF